MPSSWEIREQNVLKIYLFSYSLLRYGPNTLKGGGGGKTHPKFMKIWTKKWNFWFLYDLKEHIFIYRIAKFHVEKTPRKLLINQLIIY